MHEIQSTCFSTAVTPTPEQLYASLSPDLKKQVDMVRAARLEEEKKKEKFGQVCHAC